MAHSLDQLNGTVESAVRGVKPRFEGAYVHVPFCFHKCHYCDFYSFVDRDNRQGEYVERLEAELTAARELVQQPLHTVFVGGGTPTLLEPALLARTLHAIATTLPLADDVEWTVEANPETVTPEVAGVLAAGGVNRVSMGAQSFHPHLLKALERWHEPASVARAAAELRRAGIVRLNIDLIFGIPGATLQDWQRDVAEAVALGPKHISCYGLTYEPNTPMTARLKRGEFARCPDEVEAAMYQSVQRDLAAVGLQQYEISNWCAAGQECRHNLLYWRNKDWLAFGPSASGHAQGVRWKNIPRLGDWLASGPWSPVVDVEQVGSDARTGERLMMGLRLREGIAAAEVDELLASGTRGAERRSAIDRALESGLMEWTVEPGTAARAGAPAQSGQGALRFTDRGLLLADSVLCELI